jgi:hypothetical protein
MRLAAGDRRLWALLVTAALALGLGACTGDSAGKGSSGEAGSLGMLVRLHDLQPGFLVGEAVGCGGYYPTEGAEPPLEEFARRYRPHECEASYDRLYPVPGAKPDPATVSSIVIEAGGAEGADAGEGIATELIRHLTGNIAPQEVVPTARIGSATKLFHTRNANVLGRNGRGSIFFWRYRDLLGATLAGGRSFAEDDAIAARLAHLQLAHMGAPRPYPPSQRDDLLVPLDNPRLRLPVYWLGRTFDPGQGLPKAELREAWGPIGPGGGPPGVKVELTYDQIGRLGAWTSAGWTSYLASKLGRLVTSWRCTQTSTVQLEDGYAEIYSGYVKDFTACPARPAEVRIAAVHIGSMVVGINLPNCFNCTEPSFGPYTSQAGLEAIAKGLRLRQQAKFGGR